MEFISDADLVQRAASALRPLELSPGRWVADVGAALETPDGKVFTGSCIGGHLGLCAEMAAAGQLVGQAAPVIRRMVAVWRDPSSGVLNVLPPCGRCREFVHSLSDQNLETRVLLGPGHVVILKELLPYHFWHAEPAV